MRKTHRASVFGRAVRFAGWLSIVALAATSAASGSATGAAEGAAASSAAAPMTVIAAADALVNEAAPDTNYGAEAYLRAQGGTDPDHASYVRFGVAGLSGPAARAVLRFYVHSGSADGPAVYATSNDWTESGVTWNTRPSATTKALDDALFIAYGAWVEYDVTSQVRGDGTYSFLVASSSADGVSMNSREGIRPPELVVTPPAGDGGAPSAPANLSVTSVTAHAVSLAWTASTDDVGVAGYRVFESDRLAGTTSGVTHTVEGLACGTSYTFGVEAYDAAGNASPRTTVVASTSACPDTQAPSAPTGLTAAAAGTSHVNLAWQPATDNVAVSGYRVFESDRLAGTTSGVTHTVEGLACGTRYTFGVEAYDAAGNTSPRTTVAASTSACPDTQAPTTPTALTATAAGTSQVDLAWQPATDDVAVAGYRVFEGNRLAGTTAATAFSLTGLACGTSYMFGVEAYDAAGNASPRATAGGSTTACPDTRAPTAPTGLTATPTGPTQIDLTWQAAADDVGVVGYEVLRNGVSIATTGVATSYSDTGLAAATTYEYVVKARDAAGNVSPTSTPATATTPAPPPTTTTLPATFGALADAHVDEAQPGANFGNSTFLRAQGGLDPDEQSYVRFSVRGVTETVGRAVLRVYVRSGSVDGPAVYATETGWAESTVTWKNRPASTSGALDDELLVASGTWVEYDVTARVAGDGDYSFLIASTSSDGVTMTSREGGRAPELVLTPTESTGGGSECDRVAAPTGSDTAPGTLSAPFRTAQRLAEALTPGETGCLREGTYGTGAESSNVLRVADGGVAGAPIQIRSYPGERARLNGVVQVVNGADHVVLSRLTIDGPGGSNTVKIYAADVVVERSDITNAWRGRSCMILGSNDGGGPAVRTIVRRNRFHECGDPANGNLDHSIYAANLQDGQIVDNVFWNHAARAIQLYPNADRNLVAHNVIDGGPPSVRGGIVVGGSTLHTSSDNVLEYNIISYATDWNLYTNWQGAQGTGNVARRNCVWAGGVGNIESDDGGLAVHDNVTADPLFFWREVHDYRIWPASLCLPVVGYDTAALLLADSE